MAFGIRDLSNATIKASGSLIAIGAVLMDIRSATERIADALEARNRLEFDRRFSPQDLGIQFKTDESSPARTRGDKVERYVDR